MVRKPHKGLTVFYVDGRAAWIAPLTVETSYHATRGAGRGLRQRLRTNVDLARAALGIAARRQIGAAQIGQ